MTDGKSLGGKPPPSQDGSGAEPTNDDVPNLGPVSDPSGRDFGDSAGYGSGGSARDYRDVIGESPATIDRPNPLDAVMTTGTDHGGRQGGSADRETWPGMTDHQARSTHRERIGQDLSRAVVVITGASSGIGRATAHAFASQGARVVLAARRGDALLEAVRECEQMGGLALAVPTDVRNEAEVEQLAQAAVHAFGHIDVWVNNAAVSLFARFDDSPPEVYDEVIRTNLFGYIYGARAALKRFGNQGHGALINVASMVSYVSQPYTSAYAVSKAGIRALTDSLRQEYLDQSAIQISMVLPATIDTPFFQHAANYTGRATKAMPPVYPVGAAASTILSLARKPRRQAFVGNAARMLVTQHALAPNLTQRLVARMVHRQHLQDRPATPSSGNVLTPMTGWTSPSGGWQRADGSHRAAWLAGLALVAVPLGLLAWSYRGPSDRRARQLGARGRSLENAARLQV